MYPAEGQNKDELRMLARNTDVYLTSANGLAETGEIINIDGAGNRVSESIFGHKRSISSSARTSWLRTTTKPCGVPETLPAPGMPSV